MAEYTNNIWKNIKIWWQNTKLGQFLRNSGSNLVKGVTGSGLTDAQKEANAFEADQAQKQMAFQQQMRDTQYQSAVADMRNAGVNPALAMNQGGNVAPSGAMAASESPGQPDLVGLLGQITQLAKLRAEVKNINANTEKTEQDTEFVKQNTVNAAATLNQIQANVRKLGLEGDSLEITNSYLDDMQSVALDNQRKSGKLLESEWQESQKRISKMTTEQQKMLQDIAESKERVNYLLKQESLTDAQKAEIYETIKKIRQETANLVKEGTLLGKDIEFYSWNHASDTGVLGIRRERGQGTIEPIYDANYTDIKDNHTKYLPFGRMAKKAFGKRRRNGGGR